MLQYLVLYTHNKSKSYCLLFSTTIEQIIKLRLSSTKHANRKVQSLKQC